jgi:hypothetical protein
LWNSGTTNDSNKTVTVSSTGTWTKATLTGSASVSRGQAFAIVIRYSSGTANWNISAQGFSQNSIPVVFPLCLQDNGVGSWTILTNILCIMVSHNSTPIYIPGLWSTGTCAQTNFNSGTAKSAGPPPAGDEYAMKFVSPGKIRVIGCALALSNIAAGADFTVSLWGTGGTADRDSNALASIAVDGDLRSSSTADGVLMFYFTSAYTLTAGNTYYLGVRADTGNNLAVWVLNIGGSPPTGFLNATPGGANQYLSVRSWDAGSPKAPADAWTDDATRIVPFRLICDQIDDGNGSGGAAGGLMINPGLSGGLR